jgi:hypothetical protein
MSHHLKKLFRYTTAFFVMTVAIAGIFLSVKSTEDSKQIQSKAAVNTTNTPLNMILTLVKDKKTGDIAVQQAYANKGIALYYPPANQTKDMLIAIVGEKTISQIPVAFNDYVFADAFSNGVVSGGHYDLPLSEAVVSIPYQTGETFQIKTPVNAQLTSQIVKDPNRLVSRAAYSAYTAKPFTPGANSTITLLNRQVISPPVSLTSTTGDGYFDLAFISFEYAPAQFSLFDADVDEITNYLFQNPLFANKRYGIRITKIHNTQNFSGCTIYTVLGGAQHYYCDPASVLTIASQYGVPFDRVVVLRNNNTLFASATYPSSGGVNFLGRHTWSKQVLAHELGHSLGGLVDEYLVYTSRFPDNDPNMDPNARNYCSWGPDSALNPQIRPNTLCRWDGTPDTGCFPGCSYPNLYRPTENGIMKTGATQDIWGALEQSQMENSLFAYLKVTPFPSLTPIPTITLTACQQACLKVMCSYQTSCNCGVCVGPSQPQITKILISVSPVPSVTPTIIPPTNVVTLKPFVSPDCLKQCAAAACPQNTMCNCGICKPNPAYSTPTSVPSCASCVGIACSMQSDCVCGKCVGR